MASLVLLLGCSKQASTPANSSSKETQQLSQVESKQSTEQSSEKKQPRHILLSTKAILESLLPWFILCKGDNVTKQTAQNVARSWKSLGATPEGSRGTLEDTYKGYYGLKGVKQTIEIKDGKGCSKISKLTSQLQALANLESSS